MSVSFVSLILALDWQAHYGGFNVRQQQWEIIALLFSVLCVIGVTVIDISLVSCCNWDL